MKPVLNLTYGSGEVGMHLSCVVVLGLEASFGARFFICVVLGQFSPILFFFVRLWA